MKCVPSLLPVGVFAGEKADALTLEELRSVRLEIVGGGSVDFNRKLLDFWNSENEGYSAKQCYLDRDSAYSPAEFFDGKTVADIAALRLTNMSICGLLQVHPLLMRCEGVFEESPLVWFMFVRVRGVEVLRFADVVRRRYDQLKKMPSNCGVMSFESYFKISAQERYSIPFGISSTRTSEILLLENKVGPGRSSKELMHALFRSTNTPEYETWAASYRDFVSTASQLSTSALGKKLDALETEMQAIPFGCGPYVAKNSVELLARFRSAEVAASAGNASLVRGLSVMQQCGVGTNTSRVLTSGAKSHLTQARSACCAGETVFFSRGYS